MQRIRRNLIQFGTALGLVALAAGAARGADVAAPAPSFELAGDRNPVRLADYRGKVVYLDFWASWCGPCRKSFPWMNAMHQRYKDQGLVVLAVNLDKDRELSDRFLAATPAKFTIAYDPEGKTATAYRVKGMPSSYLIDREGRIHGLHIGFRESDADALETEISQLLAARGP